MLADAGKSVKLYRHAIGSGAKNAGIVFRSAG
jgi:hypothetical protein